MGSDGEHPKGEAPDGAATAYGGRPSFRPARKEPLVKRTLPVAGELPSYRLSGFRRDLVAGVTVAALALPSAMAYAELAGLTPVNGLYALLAPMVAYMLLGSARRLIIGTEGSVATLVAAALLPLAAPGSHWCGRAGRDAGAAGRRLLPTAARDVGGGRGRRPDAGVPGRGERIENRRQR